MTKDRVTQSLPCLAVATILAAGASLFVAVVPGTSLGAVQWQIVDKYPPPTNLDPNEVIVYEHANFVGRYIRFKLQPGMRQLLVPGLPEEMNDAISSVQVGSKVAVMMFKDANFEDVEGNRSTWPTPPNPGLGLYLLDHSEKVASDFVGDAVTSLIVFPKAQLRPIGVMLSDRGSTDHGDKFFPLPESLSQTEARYGILPNMNDDANRVTLYPNDPNAYAFGKVSVTLYEHADFRGRSITLPGADGSVPGDGVFELGPYQFSDAASSVVVRWVDNSPAFQPPPPAAKSTHATAPPAPESDSSDRTPPPPSTVFTDVSGQWNSSIGLVYSITQAGDQFEWTVANRNETGQGTIEGDRISASWKGQLGAGSAVGQITVDSSGRATELKWNNGVRFYR